MLLLHIIPSRETDAWKIDRRNDACSCGEVGVWRSRLIIFLINFWNIRTIIIYQRDKSSKEFQPCTPLEDWRRSNGTWMGEIEHAVMDKSGFQKSRWTYIQSPSRLFGHPEANYWLKVERLSMEHCWEFHLKT